MRIRKLDIKITDAISKMGGVFHGMFIDGYNRSASDIAGCIHTRINEGNYWFVMEMKNEAKVNIVGKWSPNSESNGNVYDADGLSPTIVSGAHGGCEPRIRVGVIRGRGKQNRQTLEVKDEMVTNTLTSVQKDNVILSDFRPIGVMYKGKEIKEGDGFYLNCSKDFNHGALEGISRCLKANNNDAATVQDFRIRKLTERECFRLMGVREDDIDTLLKAGISKTQLYKLAGNSIVCDVLMAIFDKMFVNTKAGKGQQLSLF